MMFLPQAENEMVSYQMEVTPILFNQMSPQ